MLVSTNLPATFEVLLPGQPAASSPAPWCVPLGFCIPSASTSLAASPQALVPAGCDGHTGQESSAISCASSRVPACPGHASSKFWTIPLLSLNQMSFFFQCSPPWYEILELLPQTILFTNLLVPAFPFIAERVGGEEAERTRCCSVWNFSLSSQFVYLYFHLLPSSLKIFEVVGLLKFLCLFSCCQRKAGLPKIYSQPWRFPTLGICAERATEGPLGNNSAV